MKSFSEVHLANEAVKKLPGWCLMLMIGREVMQERINAIIPTTMIATSTHRGHERARGESDSTSLSRPARSLELISALAASCISLLACAID